MMRALLLMSLLIVALVGCKSAPSPTGDLHGIISDAHTGEPLPKAQVSVAGQVGVFTLTTDPDGEYHAANLPAGAYLISVQATGYYAHATRVGVVADVASNGDVALEPDTAPVALAALSPTPAPTYTPWPTYTPLPTFTPIILPSATPQSTPQPAPTTTARPTPTATRQPSAGSRPTPAHGAPILQEPRDGSLFVGPRRITFRWIGSCCLGPDEYFVVSIPHPQGVEEAWVKTTAWQAPDYLYLLAPESRQLAWNVSVRRHTGQHPNGQWKGPIVSPLSETWYFTWHADEGGPISPLPTPDSPLPAPIW